MSGHRFTILTIMICLCSIAGAAAEPPVAAVGIDIQGSSFSQLRDPFCPIGYKPVSESEQIERTKIADITSRIKWPTLPLRGITHGGGKRFIAIIEGIGLVEPGDIVEMKRDSLIYRWRIDNVTAAGLSSTRLDVTETLDAKIPEKK